MVGGRVAQPERVTSTGVGQGPSQLPARTPVRPSLHPSSPSRDPSGPGEIEQPSDGKARGDGRGRALPGAEKGIPVPTGRTNARGMSANLATQWAQQPRVAPKSKSAATSSATAAPGADRVGTSAAPRAREDYDDATAVADPAHAAYRAFQDDFARSQRRGGDEPAWDSVRMPVAERDRLRQRVVAMRRVNFRGDSARETDSGEDGTRTGGTDATRTACRSMSMSLEWCCVPSRAGELCDDDVARVSRRFAPLDNRKVTRVP